MGDILNKDPNAIFSRVKTVPLVSIHAYALMPNHFHLLLESKNNAKNISLFMQKLMTAYTMYFNKANDRSGALFQGTYKSRHVDSDRYLRYLFAYIHANPFPIVSDNAEHVSPMKAILEYPYSSILDYRRILRPEAAIVDRSFFQEDCKDDTSLIQQLETWLVYHDHPKV